MLRPALHHRRKAFRTIFVSTSRPLFCARGCEILPHINMEAGDERPHLLQVIYPAVHGDTSLGVSNVVAKTRWLGIGYAVQRKPISYCVAGGTSCHPDPGCRYSLPGEVRT